MKMRTGTAMKRPVIEEQNTDKNGKESTKIGHQFLIGVTAVAVLGIAGVFLPGWIRRKKQGQSYE